MKKFKKILIGVVIGLILVCGLGFGLYKTLVDENTLSINEKKWIDDNTRNLISISVPNDISVFGYEGSGVFFDFNKFLKNDIGLNINNTTVSYQTQASGYHFDITSNYNKDGLLFYKDHFVLVSKNTGLVYDDDIASLNPAVYANDLSLVASYYKTSEDSFVSYDTYSSIVEDLNSGNINYALVSLNEFKSLLINNNMNILSHISDLNKYYYLVLGDNETLNSILTKKYNYWMENGYDDSYNKNDYQLFIDALGISDSEEDALTNKVYKYGFTENRPYEIISSGTYGGITAEYLNLFSDFAGVEFTYKKYYTSEDLAAAAINGDIDLYYNYYNLITNYIDTGELYEIDYYVVVDNSIDLSMSNLNGLSYKDVYVLKNSYLYDLIKDIEGINVITYDSSSDLKKIIKKDSIVILDANTYDYYVTNITNDYSVRYKGVLEDNTYSFRYLNDSDTFYRLFSAYTKTIDPSDIARTGIITYNKVNKKSNIVSTSAICILVVFIIGIIVLLSIHKKNKSVKIDTKVRKEDKIKFIDLLTSLKNRNYYNEKVKVWNKNTIYPQACVILDINKVKELNDSYGIEAGDIQIKAVANILIKTQVDSSEIIRTDGNEFFIYMVGYSEKQVLTYLKKLVKEFKKLPYDTGVAMGFSMIEDDTKLVEDAFNEASIQMRENKEITEEKDEKKD